MDENNLMNEHSNMESGEDNNIVNDLESKINPALLEAFDGDIEDLLTWSSKEVSFEDDEDEEEEEEEVKIEMQRTADGREVEWFNVRAEVEKPSMANDVMYAERPSDPFANLKKPSEAEVSNSSVETEWEREPQQNDTTANDISFGTMSPGSNSEMGASFEQDQTAQTSLAKSSETRDNEAKATKAKTSLKKEVSGGDTEKLHRIDPKDPHYYNYTPDAYYEFGVGPEPAMPTKREIASNGTSGMAIACMCCGIGSMLLSICVTYAIPVAVVSIVFGIITLKRKKPFDKNKVMAIVGLATASVPFLAVLVWIISMIADYI